MYLMSLFTGFAGALDGLNCAKAQQARQTSRIALKAIFRMTKDLSVDPLRLLEGLSCPTSPF